MPVVSRSSLADVFRIGADLPADRREPAIAKMDLAGSPILNFTAASTQPERMDEEVLSWFVDSQVSEAVLAVRSVGSVARVGGVTREVRVELDPARLLALDASGAGVSRRLRASQLEAPGGRADIGGIEQSVRTIGSVKSAAELARMDIVLAEGRRVRLEQIVTVAATVGERRSAALINGMPAVGFEAVIPVLFTFVDDAIVRLRRLFGWRVPGAAASRGAVA